MNRKINVEDINARKTLKFYQNTTFVNRLFFCMCASNTINNNTPVILRLANAFPPRYFVYRNNCVIELEDLFVIVNLASRKRMCCPASHLNRRIS